MTKRDNKGHRTRFSDSSFYDEVCIYCGATDGHGMTLNLQCKATEEEKIKMDEKYDAPSK